MPSEAVRRARAGLAGATRHGHPASELAARRTELLGAKIVDQIHAWVASWPPPTPEQVAAVAAVLQPGTSTRP